MIFLEDNKYYVFESKIDKEMVLQRYMEQVRLNPRFEDEMDEHLITVEEGYYVYSFISGVVTNQDYLIVQENTSKSGKLDIDYTHSPKEFLLNGLNRDLPKQEISRVTELRIFNPKEPEEAEKLFLTNLLDKGEASICARHHLIRTDKKNTLDIAPLASFKENKRAYYFEKRFIIHYRTKTKKKDIVSDFSGVLERFYTLQFVESAAFTEFLKKYKRPIVYIPQNLQNYYYDISFKVYLSTKEELKYITESELLSKIKKNLQYKEYSKYKDYLLQGIFYFKQRHFLSDFEIEKTEDHQYLLFQYYLTLSYQADSGVELAEYASMGLLEKNDWSVRQKYLMTAYRLGNQYAKKLLYEHFSHPKYYSEHFQRRYS